MATGTTSVLNLNSFYSDFGVRLRSSDIKSLQNYASTGVEQLIKYNGKTLGGIRSDIGGGSIIKGVITHTPIFNYGVSGNDECVVSYGHIVAWNDEDDMLPVGIMVTGTTTRPDSTVDTDAWAVALYKEWETPIKDTKLRDHNLVFNVKAKVFADMTELIAYFTGGLSDPDLIEHFTLYDDTKFTSNITSGTLITTQESERILTGYGYNMTIVGDTDVNGDIDVSGDVNLGSAATDEVKLRGEVVTIANSGDSNSMNMKFASASAFGNQVMGMEPASPSTPRSLTIVGQDNTSVYTGGSLTVRGGQNATLGNGGALNLYGGAGKNTSAGAGGKATLKGGNAYFAGDVDIAGGAGQYGGDVNIDGGNGVNGGDITLTAGGGSTGGNVNIFAGTAPNFGEINIGTSQTSEVSIGASDTNIILAGGGYRKILWMDLYIPLTMDGTEQTLKTYTITHEDYVSNPDNKQYRLKFNISTVAGASGSYEITIRKNGTFIAGGSGTVGSSSGAWCEVVWGAISSTNTYHATTWVSNASSNSTSYSAGHGSSGEDFTINFEGPSGYTVTITNMVLEVAEFTA